MPCGDGSQGSRGNRGSFLDVIDNTEIFNYYIWQKILVSICCMYMVLLSFKNNCYVEENLMV